MATITAPTLHSTGSHSIKFDYRQATEQVYFYFRAIWRDEPVYLSMSAIRRDHDYKDGRPRWGDWHIVSEEAYYGYLGDDGMIDRGKPVTETARARLQAAAKPMVETWLASDAYAPSAHQAYRSLLRNELRDMSVHSKDRILTLAAKLERLGFVTIDDTFAVVDAVEAYETYVAKLAALDG